jgi:DNA polymerase
MPDIRGGLPVRDDDLVVDGETRGVLDLGGPGRIGVGTHRYMRDPRTEVLCLSYALGMQPAKLWVPGEPVPPEFHAAKTFIAHSAEFERTLFRRKLGPLYGFPDIPIESWRCTMAQARILALPAALGLLADALEFTHRKGDDSAMRMMCRPRRPKKGEDPNGIYWHDSPELRERLGKYCIEDTECEREARMTLPPLNDFEQSLWCLDQAINDRGFSLDDDLIRIGQPIAAAAAEALLTEFRALTDLNSPGQVEALLKWLERRGCALTNLQKKTIAKALTRKNIDPATRRVLEIRLDAAHAAAGKPLALTAWRCDDGRVRGTLTYHGAATGRWSGHGPQPQNFKRESKNIDAKIEALLSGDAAKVSALGSPISVLGEAARGMIKATPGHWFFIGDFTGIESIVLAQVAGEKTKTDQWIKYNQTLNKADHPYMIEGLKIGYTDSDLAYRGGKINDLAFGYQGGIPAYRSFAPDDDNSTDDEIKIKQKAWRARHPRTVQFWYAIGDLAVAAVKSPGTVFHHGKLQFVCEGYFLRIKLPSGRYISYPHPRIIKNRYSRDAVIFKDNAAGKWEDYHKGSAYGGTYAENIVSGIARDLLAAAMIRLTKAGYKIVFHVHDEVVCEVPDGQGDLDEFKRLIEELPDWAIGLPLAAKVRESIRFSKSDAAPGPAPASPAPAADEETPPWEESAQDNPAPSGTTASIPLMITAAMKVRLRELGYDDEDIFSMAPAQAHEIINAAGPTPFQFAPAPPQAPSQPPPLSQPGKTAAPPRPSKKHGKGNGKADGWGNGFYQRGEQEIGDLVDEYIYKDHRGSPYLRVAKYWHYEWGNQYPQYHQENGRWLNGAPSGPKIPYRLPELLAALMTAPLPALWIGEGEKDVETLRGLGLVATCNPEGAGKWVRELNKWVEGFKTAYIVADNDDPGRKHAHMVARSLRGIIPDVRIISFRKKPDVDHDGYDVTEWIEDGGTKDRLLEIAAQAPKPATLGSICAADVEMTDVEWVWPNRFALRKIGLLVGLPDEGKGLLISWLMATVSCGGTFPCGEGTAPQGNVILMSAEDDINDTITPRLAAAGADLKRIHIINMMHDAETPEAERMFSLVTDLPELRQKIEEVGKVKLVVIDPISSYLGINKIDSFRATDVRAVLAPLKELAEELNTLVVGVMHFNKKIDITNVMLRVSDSLAYVAASRHVYGVVDDAENKRKLFIKGKNNLASRDLQPTLAFGFDAKVVGVSPRSGKPISAPLIVWHDAPVAISAFEAMSAVASSKSPGARDCAKQFVQALLGGGPVGSIEVQEAAEQNGISKTTLRRVQQSLGIKAKKDGPIVNGKATWRLHLPDAVVPDPTNLAGGPANGGGSFT